MFLVMQSVSYSFWGIGDKEKNYSRDDKYRAFSHLSSELTLTSDQTKAINAINVDFQKETIPIEGKMKMLRVDLHNAFIDKEIDEQKIIEIVRNIGENENIIKEKQTYKMFKVLKILNQGQKQKLQDLRLFSSFLGYNLYNKPPKKAR